MITMPILWTIETDATPGAAQAITRRDGWGQGGRLGTESTRGHSEALDAVKDLHDAGRTVWMSPSRDRDAEEEARAGLEAYAIGRRRLPEAVHAGLEAGMSKTSMAAIAGLSRPGLDKVIERFSFDMLVKGK